jgi:hypothetical protein
MEAEITTTLALSTFDYKGPFVAFTREQIQREHGRSYEEIISSDAPYASLNDALTHLCSDLQLRFPEKKIEHGQKYARQLLEAQPVHNDKCLRDYLESLDEVRPYFRDGVFELTLRTNFLQLKADLGDKNNGFEKFADVKRNGWWANGANYLLWAQLYHFTGKLDHFTLTATPTWGVERHVAPSAKRPKRNAEQTRRGVIYKLTCRASGMSYIGQTLRDVLRRFAEHEKALTLIGEALRRYGMSSFDIEILMIVDVPAVDIDVEETHFIIEHNTVTPNGYNGSVGNNQVHANRVLEEHRRNARQTLIIHPSALTEDERFNYDIEIRQHMNNIRQKFESLASSSSTSADPAASRGKRASMLRSVHPESALGDDRYHNAIQQWKTRADS